MGRPRRKFATAIGRSSSTRSLLIAIAAAEPSPAAVMTWARGLVALPAAQMPGTLVAPVASTWTHPVSRTAQPRFHEQRVVGSEPRPDEHGGAWDDATACDDDAGEAVVVDGEADHGFVDNADGTGHELFTLGGGQGGAVGEEHNVVGPLSDDVGVGEGLRGGRGVAGENADGLVAYLVAVAVGAMQQVAAPPLTDAGDVRDLVAQPRGHQDAPRAQRRAVLEGDVEPSQGMSAGLGALGDGGDGPGHEVASVAGDLRASGREQLAGRDAIGPEETLHVCCRGVSRLAGVDHSDVAAGAGEDQGS